jgi:hypothetical protein
MDTFNWINSTDDTFSVNGNPQNGDINDYYKSLTYHDDDGVIHIHLVDNNDQITVMIYGGNLDN